MSQTNKQSWCYIDKHFLFTNLQLAKTILRKYCKYNYLTYMDIVIISASKDR